MAKAKKAKPVIIDVCDGRKVLECDRCPKLVANRSGIVNGWGPERALIAFVGEGPGMVEDEKLRPFVGPAGQTARRWMQKLGIDPSRDVFWDNSVKCRPRRTGRPTTARSRIAESTWRRRCATSSLS